MFTAIPTPTRNRPMETAAIPPKRRAPGPRRIFRGHGRRAALIINGGTIRIDRKKPPERVSGASAIKT